MVLAALVRLLLVMTSGSSALALRPLPLTMIEHAMPLMEPHRYEAALRTAVAPQGEIIRWALTRVDQETSTAYAEVVIAPRPIRVTRPGMQRMLGLQENGEHGKG